MPAYSLDRDQAIYEIAHVENALYDGYAPPGQVLLGSHQETALRVAADRIGVEQQSIRGRCGTPKKIGSTQRRWNVAVDWSMYRSAPAPVVESPSIVPDDEPAEDPAPSPREVAQSRADILRREVHELVTGTRYPLINPEAILVEADLTRRYDADSAAYEDVPGTPRTWLSDLLKVEPIPDSCGRKFIFTGAQNDTPVHGPFWRNLQAYAKFIGAQIVIGPWTYETQWWSENSPHARVYDDEIAEYLCFGQMMIGDHFVFCGEMNTLPTAARPISDLVTHSRGRWAVFPHSKLQLKSVPSTDPSRQAHQVMTSGAVTIPKVIPRKAGVKSIFHHIVGATVVEFDDAGDVFCRQINADDSGEFYDLDRHVVDSTVTTGHRIKALVCGDIHTRKLDPLNAMATFGVDLNTRRTVYRDNIVDELRPEQILLHDVFDNESRNHHNAKDAAYSYEMAIRYRDRVMDEVKDAVDFMISIKRPGSGLVVVDSNHDLGLERYIREGRYRGDGVNFKDGLKLDEAYLEYRERVADALDTNKSPPTFSMFEYAARRMRPAELIGVDWVHDGQSHVVDGVECGHHGFRGANGSKGTISGFARIGRKMSIGDKHSPEIMDGVYCAGCMKLQHGYNKGPSSWAIAHIVQYANGKRSIITLQNGKWRADKPRIRVRAERV